MRLPGSGRRGRSGTSVSPPASSGAFQRSGRDRSLDGCRRSPPSRPDLWPFRLEARTTDRRQGPAAQASSRILCSRALLLPGRPRNVPSGSIGERAPRRPIGRMQTRRRRPTGSARKYSRGIAGRTRLARLSEGRGTGKASERWIAQGVDQKDAWRLSFCPLSFGAIELAVREREHDDCLL